MTERETHGSQKDTERKLLEKFVFLTRGGKSSVLCSGEITERERVKVEERRGGEAEQVDMSQHVAWGRNCGFREEK